MQALQWLLRQGLYRFRRYRRAVVEQNLADTFPGYSGAEREALAHAFYHHLAQLLVEILQTPRMTPDRLLDAVQVVNPELAAQASDDFSRPVVFVSLHQGNWEWMLHGMSLTLGKPVHPLYQPLHNKQADRFMRRVRTRHGASPIDARQVGADLLNNRQQPRLLAMLADQAPSARENPIYTPFLGRPTAFKPGFTRIARILQAPLLFTACHRCEDGRYRVTLSPLGEPPYARADSEVLVERYARLAEAAILEQPETWLWSHRRWKEPAD